MKTSRAREISMEVTVGAFLFMVLLALGVFTIVLSRQNIFRPVFRYEVFFPEVLSIREGDTVSLRGVPVGKIRRVEIAGKEVRVELALERELRMREDYRFEILPSSMLGGRFLNVHEGSEQAPPLPPGARLAGIAPADLMDQATRAVQKIHRSLDEGRVLENLEQTLGHLREVSEGLSQGRGTIGRLLTDDTLYGELRDIAAGLGEFSDRLRSPESTVGRLLTDGGAVYEQVEAIARNLKEITDGLRSGEGLLGRLLAPEDTLYEDLRQTAAGMREIVDTIASGEGTLGRLVRDESLFEDAKLLLGEVRAAIDDFRETSPITTFTSILFGAF